MKMLVTGTNRGLGKFLRIHFDSDRLDRETTMPVGKYDVIVHSAVSRSKDINIDTCIDYFSDNVSLTEKVLSIPCKKFIYISTIDVYPQSSPRLWKESDDLTFNTGVPLLGMYGMSKFVSESMVARFSENFLILRCAVLLNKYSRVNTIKQILDSEHHDLFVSGESKYNCVLVSDLAKFIEQAVTDNLQGIYNVASSDYICLDALAKKINSDVTFTDYVYGLSKADNSKICGVAPFFDKSTLEAISQFSQEL